MKLLIVRHDEEYERVTQIYSKDRMLEVRQRYSDGDDDNTLYSVLLSGFIVDGDVYNMTILERGFEYGPSANNLYNKVISTDLTAVFTAVVSITSGTYYRAYAITNEEGISYGDVKQFIN